MFAKNFADLSETLKASDGDLRLILDRGAVASKELETLVRDNQGNLAALLANLITVGQVTTSRVDGIQQLLVTYPDVVAGGYTVVPGDGTAHFGLALAQDPPVCTQGYQGTKKRTTRPTPATPRPTPRPGAPPRAARPPACAAPRTPPGPRRARTRPSRSLSATNPYPRAWLRRWA